MENESTQRGLPKAEGMECQARCQWRAEAESRCWPCRRLEAASTGLEAGSLGRAGRDWGQEEKGITEDEMAGWHH